MAKFTATRSVRRSARWVSPRERRRSVSTLKRSARRHERRARRQHDHLGDTDWTPRRRGPTGWEIT